VRSFAYYMREKGEKIRLLYNVRDLPRGRVRSIASMREKGEKIHFLNDVRDLPRGRVRSIASMREKGEKIRLLCERCGGIYIYI
jgi:uncharacterized pyridoxamine 5'-phosphate oxidase family protein